jgi:hypothetical protein
VAFWIAVGIPSDVSDRWDLLDQIVSENPSQYSDGVLGLVIWCVLSGLLIAGMFHKQIMRLFVLRQRKQERKSDKASESKAPIPVINPPAPSPTRPPQRSTGDIGWKRYRGVQWRGRIVGDDIDVDGPFCTNDRTLLLYERSSIAFSGVQRRAVQDSDDVTAKSIMGPIGQSLLRCPNCNATYDLSLNASGGLEALRMFGESANIGRCRSDVISQFKRELPQ